MMRFAFPILFLTLTAVSAKAADAAQPALRQACRADYKQFCPDVKPGGGRIAQCLREHADQLSSGCKDALQTAKATKEKGGN